MDPRSVLIVDDEQDSLSLLVHLLQPHLPATRIVCSRFPSQAIQLANAHAFDLVVVDVTIDYAGTQFGGLEVYKSLVDRYGGSAVLAYSQYISDELLRRYQLQVNFLDKQADLVAWSAKLAGELRRLRDRQSCFVAMPFHPGYDALYDVIRACVEGAGFRCVRVDRQAFSADIVEKILEEIRKAKLVIFAAAGQNPNAFYEAGYAVALRKEVLTVTDAFASLPFDIRGRNTIEYGADYQGLRSPLTERLLALTDRHDL